MTSDSTVRNFQNRRDLFDFLQSQMQVTYEGLKEEQRLSFESRLIKTYIFEVNLPSDMDSRESAPQREVVQRLFQPKGRQELIVHVAEKDEIGFFELGLKSSKGDAILYLDTATNRRFWLGYSISGSTTLDWWIEKLSQTHTEFDTVWLWPSFLEMVQRRGIPRGFGLDYDYRKFEGDDPEVTTYLKMQLWGGSDTDYLYRLLKEDEHFQDKIVLSKVRLKEFAAPTSEDLFALQDLKYQGKFTTRGTDFSVHAATVDFVRQEYEKKILSIEDRYALQWRESEVGKVSLEGFAIHFLPTGFRIPVEKFPDSVLNGTTPFRLLGFTQTIDEHSIVSEVVDLHTGNELSLEIYPDLISVYLPEGACGNSVARFYTNLQHFLNVRFTVQADNGDRIF